MKLLIIGCMIFLMIGCKALTPQAQQAGDLIVQATYVDELVKSGAVTESLYNSALSDKDRKTIETSLNAYNAFTAKWGRIITKNPLEAVTQTLPLRLPNFTSTFDASPPDLMVRLLPPPLILEPAGAVQV